jgi:hypothetical protein
MSEIMHIYTGFRIMLFISSINSLVAICALNSIPQFDTRVSVRVRAFLATLGLLCFSLFRSVRAASLALLIRVVTAGQHHISFRCVLR